MKGKMISPGFLLYSRNLTLLGFLLSPILLVLQAENVFAADGTWGNPAGGTWTNPANWSGGIIADGTASTANFGTLDLTSDTTVKLDGNRTIGNLYFIDTTASHNLILSPGSGGTLTFGVSSGMPSLTANNQVLVVNTVIDGSSGLHKIGPSGGGVYTQLNAANIYTGGTVIDGSISFGNAGAFSSGLVTFGGAVGAGQLYVQAAGADRTIANNIEIRSIRFIAASEAVAGQAAGNLSFSGSVFLNQGGVNVRDIYCQKDLTFSGTVSGGPGGLNLIYGKLILQGSNTFSNNVNFSAGGGLQTLNINSDAALGNPANVLNFYENATLQAAAATSISVTSGRKFNISALKTATFDVPADSTLAVAGEIKGAASADSRITKTSSGTLILTGGSGGTTLGAMSVREGKISVQGGTWTVGPIALGLDLQNFNVAGGATYEQTGGTVNAPFYAVLSQAGTSALTSTGIFSGGIFNEGGEFMVGRMNNAVMTVSGTALLNLNQLKLGDFEGYTTTCNLNGGVIACHFLATRGTAALHTSILNFNGGILRANSSQSYFIGLDADHLLTAAYVKSGGAIIDSQNFSVTIPQALLHDAGLGTAPDGGLTKIGTGTLTLSAVNTYNGNTLISNGTLSVIAPSFADTSSITINTGGVLDLPSAGTDIVGALIFDGSPRANGLYDADNSFGFITGPGKIQVGTAIPDYDQWEIDHGISGAGTTADSDHDGLSNLQEYAFGLNPSSGSSSNPVTTQLDKNLGTFTYSRRDPSLTAPLAYKVFTSTDLRIWTEDAEASQVAGAVVDKVQSVLVTLSASIPLDAPALFVRVEAR